MGNKPKLPEKIQATFDTNKGKIVCQLYPKQAPQAVENFIGLATGSKEWIDPRTSEKSNSPLYNGTIFHRVIPDFMIQGGDPLGIGIGGPGYKFADEFDPSLTFEEAGMLAMANSGPNTNGSQFFITVAPTEWLNGKHTIFGKVIVGQDVVIAISKVSRNERDKPIEPVVINKVEISYQ